MTPNPQVETPQESVQIPEDFAAYEQYRRTGELPPAAPAEPKKAAKPADTPDRGADPEPAPESDPATNDQQDESEEGDQARPPRPSRYQRRIDKLTARVRELEARGVQQPAGNAPPQQSQPQLEPTRPKPVASDFATFEAYEDAMFEWRTEQRDAAAAARESQRQAQAKVRETVDTWNSRVDEITKEIPDFDEVVEAADTPLPPAMGQAIMQSEIGPKIAYHLATHRDEALRIASLDPAGQIKAIGRLEAKLEQPVEPPKPKQSASKAPPPPKPLSGGGGKAVPRIDGDIPFSEYEKLRIAELKRAA